MHDLSKMRRLGEATYTPDPSVAVSGTGMGWALSPRCGAVNSMSTVLPVSPGVEPAAGPCSSLKTFVYLWLGGIECQRSAAKRPLNGRVHIQHRPPRDAGKIHCATHDAG